MRRSLAPLLVLAGLTFLVGLGAPAITDSDEAFYAEAAREMVQSGDWLTPAFNYEPRFQKPILYYWATAGAFLVTGATPAAARLAAALCGIGLVFVTAALTRRWYDDETALLAGAIVATSFGYVALGRMALPDLPLALCVTATIAATLVAVGDRVPRPRHWVLGAAAAAALGFLMKGPLAVVLPAIVVLPIVAIERRASRLRPADLAAAALLFVAIAAPWYVAMWWQHGNDYLTGFFFGDNLERFATDRFNEPRPWWYYGPVVLGGLLPWTPFMLTGAGTMVRMLTGRGGTGSLETRLAIWVVVPLVLLTVSVGKQPRYVLPLLPPLAMLLARGITERIRDRRGLDGGLYRRAPDRGVQAGALGAGAILLAAGALVWRAGPLFVDVPDWRTTAAAAVTAAGGVVVIGTALSRGWRRAPWVIACASAVALPLLMLGTLAGGPEDTVERVARAVVAARRADEPVGVSRVFVRNLVFYTGIKQTDLIDDEQLTMFLRQEGRALLVVPADVLARVEAAGAPPARRLGEFPYMNEAGLRLRSLIWPDPARDVQRILLVSTRD